MRILIVEDDKKLSDLLKSGLETKSFAVDVIDDGAKAVSRISLYRNEYNTIILDLMLPGKDGFQICSEIRGLGVKTPVIILTAKQEVTDKIKALDAGADDYLIKPFSLEELLARIRALTRRPEQTLSPILKAGPIELHSNTKKVYRSGKEVTLTLKEFSLLEHLIRNPNQVINREQLMDHVWGFDFNSFSNVVDVHMKNLRRKLKSNRTEPIIETIWGFGYRLNDHGKHS